MFADRTCGVLACEQPVFDAFPVVSNKHIGLTGRCKTSSRASTPEEAIRALR
jgi:hypothetical protein